MGILCFGEHYYLKCALVLNVATAVRHMYQSTIRIDDVIPIARNVLEEVAGLRPVGPASPTVSQCRQFVHDRVVVVRLVSP